MLVAAAIVPTSPLLMEGVNPAQLDDVRKTRQHLRELGEEYAAAHVDTIVVFSEHATMYPEAFSMDVADPYFASLDAFGDLGYRKRYHPDFRLIDSLQRELRADGLPVSMSTNDKLHFSLTVPLSFLTEHLPNVRIVPIAPSDLDAKSHFTFGTAVRDVITASHKRVAVIAAGDLSHALSEDAPAGFHADAEAFDKKLIAIVEHKNAAGLLQLPAQLAENAKDTARRPLLMLFGALEGMSVTPSLKSYEAPFGVGHLVAEFLFE